MVLSMCLKAEQDLKAHPKPSLSGGSLQQPLTIGTTRRCSGRAGSTGGRSWQRGLGRLAWNNCQLAAWLSNLPGLSRLSGNPGKASGEKRRWGKKWYLWWDQGIPRTLSTPGQEGLVLSGAHTALLCYLHLQPTREEVLGTALGTQRQEKGRTCVQISQHLSGKQPHSSSVSLVFSTSLCSWHRLCLAHPQPPHATLTSAPIRASPGPGHLFWKHPPLPPASLQRVPMGRQQCLPPSQPLRLASWLQVGMLSAACAPLFLLLPSLQPCTASTASARSECMAPHCLPRGAALGHGKPGASRAGTADDGCSLVGCDASPWQQLCRV